MNYALNRLAALLLAALLLAFALPVRAYGKENHDRILRIHTDSADAVFEIYEVADLLDVLFGVVKISREPTAPERARYQTESHLVAAVAADKTGEAVLDLTAAGLEDGVYLVVGQGEPFYVCVPGADAEGDGWLYTVDVYPEKAEPENGGTVQIITQEDAFWREAAAAAVTGIAGTLLLTRKRVRKQMSL